MSSANDLRGHVHRRQRLMPDADARAFLRTQKVAHVATVDDEGWPYVIPLIYIYEGEDRLWVHTGNHGGHFERNIERHPRVEPARVKPAVTKTTRPRPAPVIAKAPVAAPIEAPSSITPETGLEGREFKPSGIEPGFENGIPGGVAGGIVGGFITAPPPPPPAPVTPVRVGGAISAPRLIHRVDPEYPPMAVAAQIEGMVILEATVDEAGAVTDTRVLRSHSVLDQAAVDAVEQWRYEPLRLNGKAQPFVLTVTVSFSLAGR